MCLKNAFIHIDESPGYLHDNCFFIICFRFSVGSKVILHQILLGL